VFWISVTAVNPRRPDGKPRKTLTVAETMSAGWCWRIDHERRINRGYVFCPAFICDEEAEFVSSSRNWRFITSAPIVPPGTGAAKTTASSSFSPTRRRKSPSRSKPAIWSNCRPSRRWNCSGNGRSGSGVDERRSCR